MRRARGRWPAGRGRARHVVRVGQTGARRLGLAPGTTTAEAATIKALQVEVRELNRANEILLAASSFLARVIDPRLAW